MVINDNIYGKIKIVEPVLLELLKTPSILRLKKISQFGIPDKYYHFKNYSRYEHSVGVMILLRKLKATLEEQVAGLLHDVSVLAFSHITDWLFGDGRKGVEDYHDSIHVAFVKKTEIPKILEKYDFLEDRILDEHNFTLLERKAPDLCADRIDYALREFKYWLNFKIVSGCIKSLVNYNGEMVFSNEKIAFDFAINYLQLQTEHWGGYEAMMRYHLFSNVLEKVIGDGLLKEKDFYKDEKYVLDKFENIKDNEIQQTLKILRNKKLHDMRNRSRQKVIKKFRFVDPKVLADNKIERLSQINFEFAEILKKHSEINKRGLYV